MKTSTAIAGMLATAMIGALAAGWIMSTHAGANPAAASVEPSSALARTPMGDVAGAPQAHASLDRANPLGEGRDVVAEGQRLFVAMNCAGCHGYTGGGGMGPDLTDAQWDYGGTPMEIYKTLYEGRPKGMPAWGPALPSETLWKLAAYVHSLGGGVPPSQAQAERHGDFVAGQRDTLVNRDAAGTPAASAPAPTQTPAAPSDAP